MTKEQILPILSKLSASLGSTLPSLYKEQDLNADDILWINFQSKLILAKTFNVASASTEGELDENLQSHITKFGNGSPLIARLVLEMISVLSKGTPTKTIIDVANTHYKDSMLKLKQITVTFSPLRLTKDFIKEYYTNPATVDKKEVEYYNTKSEVFYYKLLSFFASELEEKLQKESINT